MQEMTVKWNGCNFKVVMSNGKPLEILCLETCNYVRSSERLWKEILDKLELVAA